MDDGMDLFDFAKYHGDKNQQQPAYCYRRDSVPHRDYNSENEQLFSSDSDVSSEDGPQEIDWDVVAAAKRDLFSVDPMQTSGMPLTPVSVHDDPLDHFEQLRPAIEDEKWNVDRETATFLSSVISLTSPSEELDYGLRARFQDCKAEEPFLLTDPIVDLQRLYERNAVSVTNTGMEPFVLSKKKDERLTWDAKSLKLPEQVEKELASEKIAVDIETAKYLKDIFQDAEGSILETIFRDRRDQTLLQPLSPPLLPLSPQFSSEDHLAMAGKVPLTSTPEDPNLLEAAKLDAHIMAADAIDPRNANGIETDDMYVPLGASDVNSSSPLQRKTRPLDELKVSSPLLPLHSSEPPTKKAKTVAFSDDLASFIPQQESDETEDPHEAAQGVLTAVIASVAPHTDDVIQKAKDEELIEIDTTMRVNIPTVDAITPVAPWEVNAGDQDGLLKNTRSAFSRTEKQWGGVSTLERQLQWIAFPSRLGKPRPEDDFDDGSLARNLNELDIEDDADISLMAPKQEGLRILEPDEDDEEELEPMSSDSHADTMSLPSRPISAMQSFVTPALHLPGQTVETRNVTNLASNEFGQVSSTYRQQISAAEEPLEFGSLDGLLKKRRNQLEQQDASHAAAQKSAATLGDVQSDVIGTLGQGHLSRFLTMQGVASDVRKAPSKTAAVAAISPQEQTARLPATPSSPPPAFTKPPINHDGSPLPVVILTTLLTNRPLIRSLQHHLPTLDFIERDYTTLLPSNFTSLEADLTLSPSTGLILTTLQKLKQKPLPGTRPSSAQPTLRSQLVLQAHRYETILVFITCSSPILSDRDAEALIDFTLFTTTSIPDTDVQISLIPTLPGENEHDVLAQWIAAAIVRNTPNLGPKMKVLQDETLWERWLRRAGMNVFAAQVVLDAVKAGNGDGSGDEVTIGSGRDVRPITGLAAFVLMSRAERARRFAAVMGGTRVLERVSRVVDGSWRAREGMKM